MSRFAIFIAFWIVAFSISGPGGLFPAASAQDATAGSIRGVVDDPRGLVIAGATVAIVNIDTGMRRFVTTDAEGRFSFDLLPPGD